MQRLPRLHLHLDICHCGVSPGGVRHRPAIVPRQGLPLQAVGKRRRQPRVAPSPGSRPLWERLRGRLPVTEGDGAGTPGPRPRCVGVAQGRRVDGRRVNPPGSPSAQAAHSPALMPAPRVHRRLQREGPWPGPGRRDAPRRGRGQNAGARADGQAPARAGSWRGGEGAAVGLCAPPSPARLTAVTSAQRRPGRRDL